MKEAILGILARPTLQEFLQSEAWERDFDRATLSRAAAYARDDVIDEVEWIELVSTGELIVTASVQGSRRRPYEASLVFRESRNTWGIEADCTCPVANHCKHAAALLRLLEKKLPAEGSLPAAPPGQVALSPDVGKWLAALRSEISPEKSPEKKPATQQRKLAYCIEKASTYANGPDRHVFTLRVATHNKSGSVRISSSIAQPSLARPPKYLDDTDPNLISQYFTRVRKSGYFSSNVPLAGEGWNAVLDGALAKSALYFCPDVVSYRGTPDFRPLTPGPPVEAVPDWEILDDGSARPVLRLPDRGLIVLPLLPRRYIDPAKSEIGLIQSDLPPEILARWENGPPVPYAEVSTVTGILAALPTGKPLPVPRTHETELREGLAPQPHLRVTRLTLGVFRRSLIAGIVHFRYPGSPVVWPLDDGMSDRVTWKEGDKRVFLQRDLGAEEAALARLAELDLVPLHHSFRRDDLDETTRHAVQPLAVRTNPATSWAVLLSEPGFRALADEGWTITVDPDLGLDIHEIGDFFPEIEADPDHGIDWFSFDVSGDLDGKRVSLIPHIAAAIRDGWLDALPAGEEESPDLTELRLPPYIVIPCDNPADGHLRFPSDRFVAICRQVAHFFQGRDPADEGPLRIGRLGAAGIADSLAVDSSETTRALANLGRGLRDIRELPPAEIPATVRGELRHYQHDGFRWLQFLAVHGLHGILADDMGLGKTLQTLTHLAAEHARKPGKPSLVIAPTSVVPNWAAEAEKFVPSLEVLTIHGAERAADFDKIPSADLVITSYPLLARDIGVLAAQDWHVLALDEAQHIKNPKALTAQSACKLRAAHRLCLSGTPMENHLGELWSLMRFLMPGFLGDEKSFNTRLRKPIERERSADAQLALNRRVSPLILRRTKDQVATELPAKTEIIHHIDLTKKQTDLYESVRAAMDKRVRDAISEKGLAKSHIIVLDALLKLRQICCHPQLLKLPAAKKVTESAKLDHLTGELLPTLLEEGRRILLFSQFTSMLALIGAHLTKEKIPFLKLTGQTKDRATLVKKFQAGEVPVFLISLKAGGTGLNLTAADTVIHFDPWWNPAAENQATDRAHRIGQTKPVFVHKLVCRGTIEDRILELQKHKSALVEALLSEETTKLKIDPKTLSHLLSPLK